MKYYNLKIIFITLLASIFSANAFDVGVGIHLSSYNGNNSDYVELIKKYVVGTCIESCNGIYIKNRGESNYLSERDIPSNIGKQS